ncbi:hypothetical protein ACXWRS_11920, partial [Streptococcus pyogenes]
MDSKFAWIPPRRRSFPPSSLFSPLPPLSFLLFFFLSSLFPPLPPLSSSPSPPSSFPPLLPSLLFFPLLFLPLPFPP